MTQSNKNNQKPSPPKRRVGILGVGAIGSVMAKALNFNSNLELFYFNRSEKMKVEIKYQNETTPIYLDKSLNENDVNHPLDWLIICLKEYHFEDAKSRIEQLIFPNTKVVVIRNGLDLKVPLLPFTKEENILETMIDCPVETIQRNHYHQIRKAKITLPKVDLGIDFQTLFSKSIDAEIIFSNDFKTDNWKKLIESASLGAITCLLKETCWIFEKREVQLAYTQFLEEGVKIAKADGALIPDDFVNELLRKVKTYSKEKGSSMLTDRLMGRPIEVNAKNGIIVQKGKEYQIATPFHQRACFLFEKINAQISKK